MSTNNLRFNLSKGVKHKVDVMFLADATGSMSNAIANVQANIISAYDNFVMSTKWDVQLGVAFYRDADDAVPYQVLQTITGDKRSIQAAANSLKAQGGGDTPEGQLYALTMVAQRSQAGWRNGATRIIAWFGDEYGHDPVTINGTKYTLAGAIDALQERNVQVCAFSVAPTNNLDGGPEKQATQITEQADGVETNMYVQYKVAQDGVVAFILKFIANDIP